MHPDFEAKTLPGPVHKTVTLAPTEEPPPARTGALQETLLSALDSVFTQTRPPPNVHWRIEGESNLTRICFFAQTGPVQGIYVRALHRICGRQQHPLCQVQQRLGF